MREEPTLLQPKQWLALMLMLSSDIRGHLVYLQTLWEFNGAFESGAC